MISPGLIKTLDALASFKREATIKEVGDKLGWKKSQVKNTIKGSPLVRVTYVEPHGDKKAEVYLSITSSGIEFLIKFKTQRNRLP